MEDTQKKRGRKPKVPKEDPPDADSVRKRKRGRKPKCEITSINDIRERFRDSDDRVIFHGASEPIETNLEQVQVPFGNLNITVHSAPKTLDKDELRNMYAKQASATQFRATNDDESDSSSDSGDSECEPVQEPTMEPVFAKEPVRESVRVQSRKPKPKFNKLLYHVSEHIGSTGEWPETSDTLCWWCCHKFDSIPIPCVSKYDSVKKRFKVYGIFCSWECSAAFGNSENNSLLNLILLKREWTGDASDITKAPSRYLLKPFGGFMSIEEFRTPKSNKKYHISIGTVDFISQNCIETYNDSARDYDVKVRCKPKLNTNSFFGMAGGS